MNPVIIMLVMAMMMTTTHGSSSAEIDEVVKGCPYTAIFSFGSTAASHLTVSDYLASAFHLPYPSSYMKTDTKLGYGFKFAGSTNDSVEAQVDSFMTYLHGHCSSSHHDCVHKMKNAMFVVGESGANDYNNMFFHGKPNLEIWNRITEASRYVPGVVKSVKDAIKKLIKAGAVNLVVPGSLPLGCLPSYLSVFESKDGMHYDSKQCLSGFNNFAVLHNDHLWQALIELRQEYPHVHIVYADYYNAFLALMHNHRILGFEKSSLRKACCGSGGGPYNFDANKKCGAVDVPVCSDPTKHIHWDGIQLTEEAYKHMVEGFISGNFVNPKLNLPWRRHCIM